MTVCISVYVYLYLHVIHICIHLSTFVFFRCTVYTYIHVRGYHSIKFEVPQNAESILKATGI